MTLYNASISNAALKAALVWLHFILSVAALCFAPLFYASACVSIPLTAPVVYRFIFFVCHFDWKIVRNWKFLPLAKSSIHTHIDTLIAERGQRCLCRRRCLGLDIMENQSVKKKK